MTLKKSARSADDSPLLGPGDTVGAATVVVVFAVPYFGKHQRFAVQHDQVDFTETRLVVSLPRFETALVQKGFRDLFPVTAALTRCGHSRYWAEFLSGTGRPRLNSAQAGWR